MPRLELGMIEIVGRVVGHAQAVHHRQRTMIARHREGHNLIELQLLEAEVAQCLIVEAESCVTTSMP